MSRNSINVDQFEEASVDPTLYVANPAKAQAALQTLLDDFREMGPLLDKDAKIEILRFCRINIVENYVDVNKIFSQFCLVERIKEGVLNHNGELRDETTIRDLTAFANAVGNLTGLFLRNQDKFDHMREIQNMREAVIEAISSLPPAEQTKFFTKLDELNIASY